MASSRPATPTAIQTVPAPGSPGNWRHPRLAEIEARLAASTFSERNMRKIVWNTLYILASFVIPAYLLPYVPLPGATWLEFCALWALRLLFIGQTLHAASPLVTATDDLSDIPLTPSQRALLGLPPASKPATPGSQYITPPKYAKSTTPRGSGRSVSGSSFSGSPSGLNGSPYSPSASPLFQKAVGRDAVRRLSYGTPSPLGSGQSRGLSESTSSLLPSTPSPTGPRGAGVGLSSKWIYERTKSSPSLLRSIYS